MRACCRPANFPSNGRRGYEWPALARPKNERGCKSESGDDGRMDQQILLSKNECWSVQVYRIMGIWPLTLYGGVNGFAAGFSTGTRNPMASFCSTNNDAFLYRLSWYFS